MNILSVENISKSFGERTLFSKLTFGIAAGEKVALIAKNGTGKTSLLKMLNREETPDVGQVTFRKNLVVGYLEQDPHFAHAKTPYEVVFSSDNPTIKAVREYEEALANPENADELDRTLQEMDRLNAWDAESRIKQILTQLQLVDFTADVETLSGGQRKRLALAKILIDDPDLLILDEPTNHLDLEMIEWLEEYLQGSQRSVLMVTHDRYFLENICTTLLEIDEGKLYKYEGSYSHYLTVKTERQEVEKVNLAKTKKVFKKELEWMRSTPQARTTKSKARIDSFFDIKKKAHVKTKKEEVELEIKMERLGSKIVEIHKLKKAYPNKLIVNHFDYVFKTGDRVGIAGPNGVGKSTFLKMITGREPVDSGKIVIGDTVKFGYYGQGGIVGKDDKRVIDVVKEISEAIPMAKGQKITASQLLERFLFEGNDQYTYVSKLSGGEKRRLYLCTVLMENPNFLILDEPTNDLDILTLNILEDFLMEYPGVLVVVSHDRFLLEKICSHLFVFEGEGEIKDYNGTYHEYREAKKKAEAEEKALLKFVEPKKSKEPKTAKEKTKRSYKEEREFEALPEEIEKLENRRAEITAIFENPTIDSSEFEGLSRELDAIAPALEELEIRWLELSELDPN